jgi:hypothetical protein
VHNTKEYRWGRSLPCFSEIVTRLKSILERFLNALGCINACFVSDDMLEKLPEPAQIGQTRVGGIDLNKLRMRRVAEAVLALSASPAGLTASSWPGMSARSAANPKPNMARGAPLMTSRSFGPRAWCEKSENRAATSLFQKVCEP